MPGCLEAHLVHRDCVGGRRRPYLTISPAILIRYAFGSCISRVVGRCCRND